MRAVLFTSYGPPDLLRIGDVEQPVPRRGEILVPVLAKARGIRWSKPSSEEPTQEHAELLKELLESGRIVSEIEQTYPLEEVPKAMRHIETGHATGKARGDNMSSPRHGVQLNRTLLRGTWQAEHAA